MLEFIIWKIIHNEWCSITEVMGDNNLGPDVLAFPKAKIPTIADNQLFIWLHDLYLES